MANSMGRRDWDMNLLEVNNLKVHFPVKHGRSVAFTVLLH
jgi:hypothetical protein